MSRLDQIEALFYEALSLPPGVEAVSWIEEHCRGDSEMLREVLSLLEAREEMEREPAIAPDPAPSVPIAQFGAYRAVELLARGGMSSVYLARRADGQFEQTVALKIMAAYLAGPEFLRRFGTEQKLLATLNHNNIARLLEGGVSSGGDPFLITEYVHGETVDHYCDERKLGVESRLRIFLQVCDAVDYAHRNLIVHRDLKPGNILVNQEGTVKLLDFGTASLMAAQDDVTVTRARMLTPRYASPEQLRGERVNIATDVFSLGVVLYELLTGAWPFGDPSSVLTGLNRAVEDVPAKPPSTVITAESAERRSVSHQHLGRILKGDLSPVIMKALEGEPARRYESARQFANDIENYLEGRPVLARPQTILYQARKFVRRRWLPVSAAAVFALGLSAAAAIAVHQARTARAEALKAERVNSFLNDMLSSASDARFDPQKFTVAQMLDAAQPRLEKSWKGDPLTKATLQKSLGGSYLTIQQLDRAQSNLESALTTFEALGDGKEVASTLRLLAETAVWQGRLEVAIKLYERALASLLHLGKDAPSRLVFDIKTGFASLLTNLNRRLPEARALFEQAVALADRDPSIPRTQLAAALSHFAWIPINAGKSEEAEALLHKALTTGRQENAGGLWEAGSLYGLMNVLAKRQDFAGAREVAHQRFDLCVKYLGPENPNTATSQLFWAQYMAQSGQAAEAIEQVRAAMPAIRKAWQPGNANLYYPLIAAARVLNVAEQFVEAEGYARESLDLVESAHLGELDERRVESLMSLGLALHGQKKRREAIPVLQRAEAIYRKMGPASAKSLERVQALLKDAEVIPYRAQDPRYSHSQ